jgi:surface protein
MAAASASLDFVHKNLKKETKYREDQKELIEKALEITNGDPLGALQYIVSCLAHEGLDVEFELEYCINETCILIPIIETEPKDPLGFYVSWGDGTITHNETEHTYKKENKPVDYIIRFFGLGIKQFGKYGISNKIIKFGGYGISNKITKIISFGNLGHTFTSLAYACANCYNLESVPLNIPKSVTNLSNMFGNCLNFNQSINTWDTSNITNMSGMFIGCSKFNQSINEWDVSKVTDMHCMFLFCYVFEQPLDKWDISKVTDMTYMFAHSMTPYQSLWKIGSGTATNFMFKGSKSIEE